MTEIEKELFRYIYDNGSSYYPTVWLYNPHGEKMIKYVEMMIDFFGDLSSKTVTDISVLDNFKHSRTPFIMHIITSDVVYYIDYDENGDYVYEIKHPINQHTIMRNVNQTKIINPDQDYIDRVKRFLLMEKI